MKVLQIGLLSIWISGFLLIGFSLYATQRLSSIKPQTNGNSPLFNRKNVADSSSIKITIFTAPRPFTGLTGNRQALAIRSWLALSPLITVVLFSQDVSVVSFAAAFYSRVLVDSDIDFNFLGTPFFHSMIAKSQAFTSDVSVIVDPETIIMSDFISTLNFLQKVYCHWLLFSSSRNVSNFPFQLDESGSHWLSNSGKRMRIHELQEIIRQSGQWEICDGRMLMAWSGVDTPLHNGVLPPFLYGKGTHNDWIIHEAISSDLRFVFDASSTITSFHLNLEKWPTSTPGNPQAPDIDERRWEYVGNSMLGALYGSFVYHEANYSPLVKLSKCNGKYIFMNTKRNDIYPLAYEGLVHLMKDKIGPLFGKRNSRSCIDVMNLSSSKLDCPLKKQMEVSSSLELPFSLESLVSAVADKNRTIIVSVSGYSYKDMLMSWVCRARQLLITNFLICALDKETYDFSIWQGLPVFKDSLAPGDISFDNCHFGTKCFQRVTKVKSRVVLKILKLGYNVLLSDVDVYWFSNPLPLLHSFGPSVLAAQSDEYNKQGPINLPRRLNSGFYFAHSDSATTAAIEKIVKHAATSSLSEQPSFYDILCGEGGSNRIGNDKCVEPETNLTSHFLDRNLFPNGAYLGLWEYKNVKRACMKIGCIIIHNNWINGRLKKIERQISSGLWEYDPVTRMCLRSWIGHSPEVNFEE